MGRPGKHWVEKKWVELTPTRLFSQQFYVKNLVQSSPVPSPGKHLRQQKQEHVKRKGLGGSSIKKDRYIISSIL